MTARDDVEESKSSPRIFPTVTSLFLLPLFLSFTLLSHLSHPTTMVLISSKTLIQAHAVLLLVIAGYLVKNPETITDSDLVFMLGESLNIVTTPPTLSRREQTD